MIKYSKIINEETGLCEVGLGTNNQFYISIGMKLMDVQQSDIDNNWYLAEKCPMKTDEQKQQEEAERVAKLTCTKRVFALMLQEMGITYAMLKELIATNEQAQLEWDLCVELQRGNPLLDVMASELHITPEQLDGLFKYANGEITLDDFRGLLVTHDEEGENGTTSEITETVDPSVTQDDEVENDVV